MSALRGERESRCAARVRARAAVKRLVISRGCEGLTMEEIAEAAGLAEEDLRRHYASVGDCLLDAYLDLGQDFDRRVFGAFESVEAWRPALRAAAYAAARYIEEKPRDVRFAAIDLLEAGPLIQAHRDRHLQRLVDLVDLGRQELDDPGSLGRSIAEGVIGAVIELISKELRRGAPKKPVDYVPELMYLAVRPYLGHEVAREELSMPPPEQTNQKP